MLNCGNYKQGVCKAVNVVLRRSMYHPLSTPLGGF